jgi:sec-independent protein translocase protein TatB
MFDIGWSELLLIGVVALVVIGPKELPGVLRTLGQWMRKVRSMAGDFQNQFQEAMREAEMADLKKQVDDLAHDFTHYDPLSEVRKDVETAGRDIETSLQHAPKTEPAPSSEMPAAASAPTDLAPPQPEATPPAPMPEVTIEPAPDAEPVAAESAKPESGGRPA